MRAMDTASILTQIDGDPAGQRSISPRHTGVLEHGHFSNGLTDTKRMEVSADTYRTSNDKAPVTHTNIDQMSSQDLAQGILAIREDLEGTKAVADKLRQSSKDTLAQLKAAQIMRRPLATNKRPARSSINALQDRIAELESHQVVQLHILIQKRREEAKKDAEIARLNEKLARFYDNDGGLRAKLDEQEAYIEELEWENVLKSRTIASTATLANRATLLHCGQPALDEPQIDRLSHPAYISRLLVQAEKALQALPEGSEASPSAETSISGESSDGDDDEGSLYYDSAEEEKQSKEKVNKDQQKREKAARDQKLVCDPGLPAGWTQNEIRLSIENGSVTAESLASHRTE